MSYSCKGCFDSVHRSWPFGGAASGARDDRPPGADAHPGPRHSLSPRSPRPHRHRPDRHRQDRCLDRGSTHDTRRIVAQAPKQRQTLLFSATMPREIADLAKAYLREPKRIEVAPQATTVDKVDQRVIHVDHARKPALLGHLLG